MRYCIYCLLISTKLVLVDPITFVCNRCGKMITVHETEISQLISQMEKATALLKERKKKNGT